MSARQVFVATKVVEEVGEIADFKLFEASKWATLYIAAGKKDKINKVDIVGYLIKKGELEKNDVGLIEVKDTTSYVAVARNKVKEVLKKLANEKLKGKKIKMEIAY